MSTLEKKNYFMAYLYFQMACLAQREVERFTKLMSTALGTENVRLLDSVTDNIYDPDIKPTEETFEKILRVHDVQMDWVDWSATAPVAPEGQAMSKKKKTKVSGESSV
jgi:hypothetical protein